MPSTTTSSDWVLRIGALITALGLIFAMIALLPLVFPDVEMPGALWFLAMLTGVGLMVVFVGLVMSARQRRRPR